MKSKLLYVLLGIAVVIAVSFAALRKSSTTSGKERLEFLLDWKMSSFYAPYLLSEDEGYYAAEGLDVRVIEGQGAETSAKLIGQGTYKIGTCNAAATAIAVDNGIPVLSVAMIEQDAVTAIFSLKGQNIKQPSDLVGKTLGVRYYDISHKEYLAMMRAKGLDASKVKEVNVGFDLQPLLTGQVDALYNYAYNLPIILELQGQEVNKILVKDNGVRGYGSNIVTNRDFAASHGEIVRRFLRASRKGWEATIADPNKAVAVLKKRYPETDTKVALATLVEQLRWIGSSNRIFTQSEERWSDVLETYEALGVIKKKLQPKDVFSVQYSN